MLHTLLDDSPDRKGIETETFMRESVDCSAAPVLASCLPGEAALESGPAHQDPLESGRHCILLVTEDSGAERSIVRSLKRRRFTAERARSMLELQTRVARIDVGAPRVVFLDLELPDATGEEWVYMVRRSFVHAAIVAFGEDLSAERAARLLGIGVPSLLKPVAPLAFARLASELYASHTSDAQQRGRDSLVSASANPRGSLGVTLESYASARALSKQQRLILGFYLSGQNDKEIAQTLACSEATVYEHWRRMGKKTGASTKSAVISDFHRFLVHH
jgi:two-component system, NarL family, nitrate/nitrite response regulator NarL